MRRKKAEKLAAIGLTLEQWEVCEQRRSPKRGSKTRRSPAPALTRTPLHEGRRGGKEAHESRSASQRQQSRRSEMAHAYKQVSGPHSRAPPTARAEATRAKISIALKKRWQDPDFRTRVSGPTPERHRNATCALMLLAPARIAYRDPHRGESDAYGRRHAPHRGNAADYFRED